MKVFAESRRRYHMYTHQYRMGERFGSEQNARIRGMLARYSSSLSVIDVLRADAGRLKITIVEVVFDRRVESA